MKSKQLFENDSNVQKFLGIFSATYCWPQTSEPKCWSQVMTEQYDWFLAKLWPNVVNNVPKITADDSAVRQMNELLFVLVVKDLDLLSFSDTKVFESVLDLFNDEITFGLIFWLKVCHQFNWRLIYSQLIGEHKHCRPLLEAIAEEIGSKGQLKCFTSEEMLYFYSIIDCVYIQTIAKNIINVKTNENQFFNQFLANTSDKSSKHHSKCDLIVRQLFTFNVITQELIGSALRLDSSDDIEEQLNQIERQFGHRFTELDIETVVDSKDWRIHEDIGFARDNQKSLNLVNKKFLALNQLPIELSSLKRFYNSINTKTDLSIVSNHFTYLSNVLKDENNDNYLRLLDLILNFDEIDPRFVTQILREFGPKQIQKYDLHLALAQKVVRISKQSSGSVLWSQLLLKSLSTAQDIDLKPRFDGLKIQTIVSVNRLIEEMKTLFNQLTEDNPQLIDELIHKVIVGVYLDPRSVFDVVLELALNHSRAQTPFVARIICNELNSLSNYVLNSGNDSKNPFLFKMIVFKLTEDQTMDRVDNLSALIKHINSTLLQEGLLPVLSLEDLFFFLIDSQIAANSENFVCLMLSLIKNILDLSGDEEWNRLREQPVPTLVFLIQYLDYFWWNGIQKQIVVEILDSVLEMKMISNLTQRQFEVFERFVLRIKRPKASTHRIYLAYCRQRLPKPIEQIIDVTQHVFHDQILHYAAICRAEDYAWIAETYPQYNLFETHIKEALEYILPALTSQEWFRLYHFLNRYFSNSQVIHLLRFGATNAKREGINKRFLISNLLNLTNDLVLKELMSKSVEGCDETKLRSLRMDLTVLFKTLAVLDFQMLASDLRVRLEAILTELANKMKAESMDGWDLYTSSQLPPITRQIFRRIFGIQSSVNPMPNENNLISILPAGAQVAAQVAKCQTRDNFD